MVRRRREEDYAELLVKEDGSVQLNIDLPPSQTVVDPPEEWDVATRQQYVEWEVRRLRARLPMGITSIECTEAPAIAVSKTGELRTVEGPPPWRVAAVINGPEGGPYHVPKGMRLLAMLPEEYPAGPPDLSIMQTVHHFFLDHDNSLPTIFYELLTDIAEGSPTSGAVRYSLREALRLLFHVLQTPLHPCEGCQEQFDAYARVNR